MGKHLVAAAQLGPASPARRDTVARIVRLVEQAGREGVGFLVLPELALSTYFATVVHEDVTPYFEPGLPAPDTAPIFQAVAAHGITTVLPFAEQQGPRFFNTAALLDRDGREVGRYRKTHIPGQREPADDGSLKILEKRYFTPGDLGFPVFDTPIGPTGILICYDRRFPEAYRCLALGGAEVIAIGYNTPVFPGNTLARGQEQSELCMRAGANANGVYVIAAAKAGVEGGVEYIGGSVVIDPTGDILRKAQSSDDELVLADIDSDAGARVRERLNLDVNRRPELYGDLARMRAPVA